MDQPPQEFSDSSKEMLSGHSKGRDQHGIPVAYDYSKVVFRKHPEDKRHEIQCWNRAHEILRSITADVGDLHGRIEFSQNWLLRKLNPLRRSSIQQSTNLTVGLSNDTSVGSEVTALENRKRSLVAHWKEISMATGILLRHTLIDVPDAFPETFELSQAPWTMIRFWSDVSHTKYDDSLGFRCSKWMECELTNSFSELKERGILTMQGLRDHCQEASDPSCWISLCDNASWTLKHMGRARHVAIISVPNFEPRKRISIWCKDRLALLSVAERVFDWARYHSVTCFLGAVTVEGHRHMPGSKVLAALLFWVLCLCFLRTRSNVRCHVDVTEGKDRRMVDLRMTSPLVLERQEAGHRGTYKVLRDPIQACAFSRIS